jgi:hypothetical protein
VTCSTTSFPGPGRSTVPLLQMPPHMLKAGTSLPGGTGFGIVVPDMTEISERYRKVAGQFTRRAEAVSEQAWDNPSPCPVEAWGAVSSVIQATLDDPEMAAREFDGPGGRMTVEQAVDQFVTGDVL